MKMAIYGAGSLGIVLGALLTKNGYAVDLIKRNAKDIAALNRDGAIVTGTLELVQPVKALTPDEMTDQYDLIFYLTKTTHNKSALGYCSKHLKPDGTILCMQNGLPEDEVIEYMGKERVVGCVTGWGATHIGGAVSKLTSEPDHMTYDIGELDGRITDRIRKIEEILNHAGKVNVHTNLVGIRWTKLTNNSCYSSMGAIIAGTYGDVLDSPQAVRCAAFIMNESVAVAKAAGVQPVPFQSYDHTKLTFSTEKELQEKLPGIRALVEHHRGIRTQMIYDIEGGQMPEIDTYNAIFTKWGDKYGVETPVNKQVVQIIKDMATGKFQLDPANVNRIQLPELPKE